jgi:phosphoglycolate phosphatase
MLRAEMDAPARLVIFDFDGTLVDSLGVALAAYNAVADRMGVRAVSEGEVPELRALPALGIIRHLGLSPWKVPRVVAAVRAEMKRGLAVAPPVPGVVDALHGLAANGCALGVLTSNSRDNAERFFRRHGFPPLESVVGGVGLFGKARALTKLLRARPATDDRCVYVGDEVRDVAAAREAGIPVVAVGWGYSTPAALGAVHPDALVEQPATLAASVISRLALADDP